MATTISPHTTKIICTLEQFMTCMSTFLPTNFPAELDKVSFKGGVIKHLMVTPNGS